MTTTIYEKYSINRLLVSFSLPAIASLIIETLTSVIDTSFAGHLDNKSEAALAALGLLSPLLAIFVALQTLFAASTAIMISKCLGRGDDVGVQTYFTIGFTMTVVVSLCTSLVTFLFMDPLLLFLGAVGDTYTLASDYLQIILISNVFSSLGYTLTSSIRAFGHPQAETAIILLSVVINIIGNTILTFGLQLGMTGIALGTLISELLCALLSLIYLYKKKRWFTSRTFSLSEHLLFSYTLFKIGLAQTIIQIIAGMSAFTINYQLITTGGAPYISTWNIANKLYMLMLMPVIGMTQGVQTILAYFDGKNEETKKKSTVRKTISACLVYGIAVTAMIYLFEKPLLYLFTSNPSLLESAVNVVQVIFFTFPLLGITYTVMTILQVTGKEGGAILLSLLRQVIILIPLVIVIPIIFDMFHLPQIDPAFSIFFAIPLADMLTLGCAFIFLTATRSSSNQ
ncbi:MATE family efflux transporter [Aneurinibacillus sp. REN35]|uniref:MATE family efflux transporter n=1 Tax=Aneurinibacillus sp. REN35 TaxID=3237286 RepID=UPI0035295917